MKLKLSLALFCFSLFIVGCKKSPPYEGSPIVGKWYLVSYKSNSTFGQNGSGPKAKESSVPISIQGFVEFFEDGSYKGVAEEGITTTSCNYWASIHMSPEMYENLTWSNFLFNNLLPVTIGNIIGGAVMVGLVYWFVYLRDSKREL